MPIELVALRLRRLFQSIKMRVEIGDPLVGIELHGLFEIAHRLFIVGGAAKDKSPIGHAIARLSSCS